MRMSINKDAKGRVHLYIRYKDKQGIEHRSHFSKPEWKNLKDAKPFQEQYMAEIGLSGSKATINQLFEIYVTKHKMKQRSVYTYRSVHENYIKDDVGKLQIGQVNQRILVKWQDKLLSKGLSNNYINKIQSTLKTVLKYAVDYEYIDRNPFTIANVSVDEKKKVVQHWTPEEFDQFIRKVDDDDYRDFFTLLYWTGLRFSEATALRVKDFDSVNGTIDVNKQWDAVHKVDTSPKTHNSYRTVVCTNEVKTLLTDRVKVYSTAYGFDNDSILFGFHTHMPLTTIQHALERYIKRAGVKRINVHAFRHSHVFLLRSLGFDAFDIAKRLGHTVEMVNNTYGQWFTEAQFKMVDKLNEFSKNGTQTAHEKNEHEKKPIN